MIGVAVEDSREQRVLLGPPIAVVFKFIISSTGVKIFSLLREIFEL